MQKRVSIIRQVIVCPRCGKDDLLEVGEDSCEAFYTCSKCGFSVSAHADNAREAVREVARKVRGQFKEVF